MGAACSGHFRGRERDSERGFWTRDSGCDALLGTLCTLVLSWWGLGGLGDGGG